jgi:ATP-binding cassette subfamily B protein
MTPKSIKNQNTVIQMFKIIAKHYGKTLNIQTLRELSETTREGSNLLNLSEAAESLGLKH